MALNCQLKAQESLPVRNKRPLYSLNKRLGGHDRRSGRYGEEKILGIEP
jgi:hypothetical protein